jgi:hypothetical protein
MATPTFTDALTQAEALARDAMPDRGTRIDQALSLVKNGHVFQCDDGHWQVDSTTTPGRTYNVDGSCPCPDSHFRGDVCKHRLAVYLSRKVLQLMATVATQPPVCPVDTQSTVTPAPPALPEAIFSATLKGTINGHETLLTVRGMTATEFATNLQAVQGVLDAPDPASQPRQPASQGTETPQCPTHGALKASTKGKGFYCPHRLDDGSWCPHTGR